MLKKIEEYIKNKNYKSRSLLLGIAKFLILTSILLIGLSILIKLLIILEMFDDIVSGGFILVGSILKNLVLFFISLGLCLFFTINLEKKIDKYFLSFHTEEEIIDNIQKYYYFSEEERFRNIYKEKEDKILEKLKEITPNLSDNWLLNLSGTVDVRKLLLSKDIIWYSDQVSKKDLYVFCKKTIEEIIEKEEKEYYHIILELFESFLEEENKFKIKNKIIKENVVSIIHI